VKFIHYSALFAYRIDFYLRSCRRVAVISPYGRVAQNKKSNQSFQLLLHCFIFVDSRCRSVALLRIGEKAHIPPERAVWLQRKAEILESSRHTSPIVLVAAVIAGSVALIQQDGFFDGVFRSDILANVKAEEVLNVADLANRVDTATVDHRATAAIH